MKYLFKRKDSYKSAKAEQNSSVPDTKAELNIGHSIFHFLICQIVNKYRNFSVEFFLFLIKTKYG